MNVLRTVFLLTLLTLLLVWLGHAVGGRTGMMIALAIGLALNFFNYWFSSSLVLKAYGARTLAPGEAPALEQDVRELCDAAGLPMPKLAIVPKSTPNAFATGRNPEHAVVAVTEGLLQLCSRRQVKAVLAHEISHVKHRDMLTMTLVAGAVSAISMLAMMARFGAMFGGRRSDDDRSSGFALLIAALVAPFAAMLVQMAISRSREYAADDGAAEYGRDPAALADALEALHREIPHREPMSATGATAHMMIANPMHGLANLFSTHPSPEKRIARLRAMAAGR